MPLSNITADQNSYTFTLYCRDSDSGVLNSSIDSGSIRVVGNSFNKAPTIVSKTPSSANASVIAVQCSVAGPFSNATNGLFEVRAIASEASDVAGNKVGASLIGSFECAIGLPLQVDSTPPTVTSSPSNITAEKTNHEFTVVVTDSESTVNRNSVSSSAILVTSTGGFSQLATLVSKSPAGNAGTVTAVYRTVRTFAEGEGDTYTISRVAGAIADVEGNTVTAGAIATFTSSIAPAVPSDGNPPKISISSFDLNESEGRFYVNASDLSEINLSTLTNQNFNFINPSGNKESTESSVSIQNLNSNDPNSVSLEVVWDYSQVPLSQDGEWIFRAYFIEDTLSNRLPITHIQTFTLNRSNEVPDEEPPVVEVSSSNLSETEGRFNITVTDRSGVNLSTLGLEYFNFINFAARKESTESSVSIQNLNSNDPNSVSLEVVWDYSQVPLSQDGEWIFRAYFIEDTLSNRLPITQVQTFTLDRSNAPDTAAPELLVSSFSLGEFEGRFYVTVADRSGVNLSTLTNQYFNFINPSGNKESTESSVSIQNLNSNDPNSVSLEVVWDYSQVPLSQDGEWIFRAYFIEDTLSNRLPITQVQTFTLDRSNAPDTAAPELLVSSFSLGEFEGRFYVTVADRSGVNLSTLTNQYFNFINPSGNKESTESSVSIQNLNSNDPNSVSLEVVWDYSQVPLSQDGEWIFRAYFIEDTLSNRLPITQVQTFTLDRTTDNGSNTGSGTNSTNKIYKNHYIPSDACFDASQEFEYIGTTYLPLNKTGDSSKASQNTERFLNLFPRFGKYHTNVDNEKARKIPIYFPEGIYYFDGPVYWLNGFTLLGDGPGRTIFRLKENSAGFNDPSNPKRFMEPGYPQKDYAGFGFDNNVEGIEIQVERNNRGCVPFSWYGSNQGHVYDLKVTDLTNTAYAGIGCRGGSGPSLLMGIEVEGFNSGIIVGSGATFKDVVLRGQRSTALLNENIKILNRDDQPNLNAINNGNSYSWGGGVQSSGAIPTFQNLKSIQSGGVSVFKQGSDALSRGACLTILDAEFTNTGGPSTTAIDSTGSTYLRNITWSGYSSLAEMRSPQPRRTVGAGQSSIVEFSSDDFSPANARSAEIVSWVDSPVSLNPPSSMNWVSTESVGIGIDDNDDDTAKFQELIDDGAEVIYIPRIFPGGSKGVRLSEPLIIRNNLKYIAGYASGFYCRPDANFSNNSVFKIEDTGHPFVMTGVDLGDFEQMRNITIFEHKSPHPFVLSGCKGISGFSLSGKPDKLTYVDHAYNATINNPGDVWIYDIVGNYQLNFDKGNTFRAIQLNWNKPDARRMPETPIVKVSNGSKACIVQMRPENPHNYNPSIIQVDTGGTLNMYGLWHDVIGGPDGQPFMVAKDGGLLMANCSFPCGVGVPYGTNPNPTVGYKNYETLIRDTKNGVTKDHMLYNMERVVNVHYVCTKYTSDIQR